jgi:signal transduction histidine kinase
VVTRLRFDTIRGHLVLLVLAVVVPLVLFALVTVGFVLWLERRTGEDRVLDAARTVALALDREFASAEAALRVLATSMVLRQGDLLRFREQALVARTSDEAWILLFDRNAMQVLNTRFPPGIPRVRRSNPERVTEIFATRQPSVSDLYVGALAQRLIATVDVPVIWNDKVQYVLTQSFFPEYFDRLTREYPLPEEWVVGIFDRNGITVARSLRSADFIGRPIRPELLAAARAAPEGSLEHTTRDGLQVHDAFTRSRRSQWIVAVAAPMSVLNAPVFKALTVIGAGAALALAVAGALAILFAKRISAPLAATASAARSMGRGEPPSPVTSSAVEIRQISTALHEAANAITGREQRVAELNRDLERLLREAQRANAAKDDFIATVSHELRTPLNAMLGWVWLLRAGTLDERTRQRALETIERSGKAQARLIEDLLDVSRIVAKTLRIERAPVGVRTVVAGAIDTIRPIADRKPIELRLDLGAHELVVEGDRTRLEQVALNILSNAVKFTPAGGHVEVRLGRTEGQVELVVKDSGIGIAPDVLPHVFDHFRQADQSSTRHHGGLGLGLTIVRQLVELHGGTVTAESTGLGAGATFAVRLPLARAEVAGVSRPAVADAGRPPLGGLEGLRVLLVEDNEDNLAVVEHQLTLAGARVVAVASATQALEALERQRPDVVVTDISMPEQDGYTLLATIRARFHEGRPIPAVALTAHAQQEDRARASAAGFTAHVAKPIDPDQLVAAVRAALPTHR